MSSKWRERAPKYTKWCYTDSSHLYLHCHLFQHKRKLIKSTPTGSCVKWLSPHIFSCNNQSLRIIPLNSYRRENENCGPFPNQETWPHHGNCFLKRNCRELRFLLRQPAPSCPKATPLSPLLLQGRSPYYVAYLPWGEHGPKVASGVRQYLLTCSLCCLLAVSP